MNTPRALWIAALAVAAALALPRYVAAQAAEDGLLVSGKGMATIKPTLVEIDVDVSASAELTGDAIVKFRDAKKRVRDAFAALKLADLTVEERGLAVDQKGAAFNPYMMDMGTPSKAKSEIQLSRKLVVKARGIEKLEEEAVLQLVGRLLDVAQDAGGRVGPPGNNSYMIYRYGGSSGTPLARFIVEDVEKVKEEALGRAAADARSKAEKLARLNGVELGPVTAVREIPGARSSSGSMYNPYFGTIENLPDENEQHERLEINKFQVVPVHVELQVRFGIRPKSDGQGKAVTP